MRENFIRLIESYPELTRSSFGKNERLDQMFSSLKDEVETLFRMPNLKVKTSYGKGRWATVPWLALLNSNITRSVSQGIYVVYLLSPSRESVFLTLNQGTGGIVKGQITDEIRQIRNELMGRFQSQTRFRLGEIPEGFLDPHRGERPRAYEQACILWKEYGLNDLQSLDDRDLLDDLKSLVDLYSGLEKENNDKVDQIDELKQTDFIIEILIEDLSKANLQFHPTLITRFVGSLLAKPFVILTGLSGSGKTKLAQTFVKWICKDENQYRIIPVGADWTNREPLLGYPNALNDGEYVKPDNGVLDLIEHSVQNSDQPHFLILDEMNLSHVERYFADFLSVMESKEEIPLYAEGTIKKGAPAKVKIPFNLFIVGTVNIDETTNMFSPKVLDRANTIEFRVTKGEMKEFLDNARNIEMELLIGKGASMAKGFLDLVASKPIDIKDQAVVNSALLQFFGELKKTGAEFGYRSATEILRLIHQLSVLDDTLTLNHKLDIAIMQKLLPKLHGSRRKMCPILETLGSFCLSGDGKIVKDVFEKTDFEFGASSVLYPLSLEKIARMYRGAIENGFTSFAEA